MEDSFDNLLQGTLRNIVFKQARKGGYMGFDSSFPFYAQGATKAYGWGAGTAQGRYADVIAFAYRLEKDEDRRSMYFSILSQFADYALGLNPLGQSFVTSLGSVQVNSPLHLDSWFTRTQKGIGVVPGLLVYGPSADRSGAEYQRVVSDTLYPTWEELPLQRRWTDGWSLVNNNEFTVWETSVWNMCLYGVLYNASAAL
jgi:endoglucanase